MALNFPNAPLVGQVFSAEGADFVWSGALWVLLSAANFPWATAAEAIAGARADVAISPLTQNAAIDVRDYGDKGNFQQLPVELATSGQRVINATYQNDTGRSLLVALVMRPTTAAGMFFLLMGAQAGNLSTVGIEAGSGVDRRRTLIGAVPPAWFYRAETVDPGITIQFWNEYRG